MAKRVVLVGQCGIDGPMLQSEIESILGSVEVYACNGEGELKEVCDRGVDLVLFNRELNWGFEDRSGVEAIRKLKGEHPEVKMMLVSDYPEAQAEAVAAGAVPGFGKADVGSARVAEAIGEAIGGREGRG
ncbi:MAG: hypothetical protein ACM359_16165 [Bacillota bacterium]